MGRNRPQYGLNQLCHYAKYRLLFGRLPRIDHLQVATVEILRVARCNGRIVDLGYGSDHQIHRIGVETFGFPFGSNLPVDAGGFFIKSVYPPDEAFLNKSRKSDFQPLTAPTLGQPGQTTLDFSDGDGRDAQGRRALPTYPSHHACIRLLLHQLGNHVGIEQYHMRQNPPTDGGIGASAVRHPPLL